VPALAPQWLLEKKLTPRRRGLTIPSVNIPQWRLGLALVIGIGLPITGHARKDPPAEELLRGAAQNIQTAGQFRVVLEIESEWKADGYLQRFESTHELMVRRPDRLALKHRRGLYGANVATDGKTLSIHPLLAPQYFEEPAPAGVADLAGDSKYWSYAVQSLGPGYGLLNCLLAGDVYKDLMDGVTNIQSLGRAQIDGQSCHHLRLLQHEARWEAWITEDAPARVAQIQIGLLPEHPWLSRARGAWKEMDIRSVLRLRNWNFSDTVLDAEFVFAAPEGVRKKTDERDPEEDEEEESPLLGQEAPAFKLSLLDEGELDLAAHRDRQVVILDFWATWCGPCVMALPVLAEVAAEFKDRDVVFYAINLRENSRQIQSFLKKRGLDITVALDPDGKVGELFKVEGIPQTVIVGKDGKVAHVHVGFSRTLKKDLTDTLEKILAGSPAAGDGAEPE
jgi:thiol-disulfide isomerase/thioredoxin